LEETQGAEEGFVKKEEATTPKAEPKQGDEPKKSPSLERFKNAECGWDGSLPKRLQDEM
jgi:hypothetical protein